MVGPGRSAVKPGWPLAPDAGGGYKRDMNDVGDSGLVRQVLDFWFGAPGSAEHGHKREAWFEVDAGFDADIRERFGDATEAASRGELDHLATAADGALALLILLDQFPRNLYRGTPRSFASDAKACEVATAAVERGFDVELSDVERQFIYLPFEHSENLADQECSCDLFATIDDGGDGLDWAERHHRVIQRFGRFPHRNAVLGRETTAEEQAFLDETPHGF